MLWFSKILLSAPASAVGASFIEFTVIVTVASFEEAFESFTLNLILSLPLKFSVGIYVIFGAVPLKLPCVGCCVIWYIKLSPSASVAVSVIAFWVSSSVLIFWLFAVGVWFGFVLTTTLTLSLAFAPSLSVTSQVYACVPTFSVVGVV